jgi:hypothetical protein
MPAPNASRQTLVIIQIFLKLMLLSEASISLTEFWVLIAAMAGGVIIILGLGVERVAEWMNDTFLGEYKVHKGLADSGLAIVVFGLIWEIAVAGWSANDAWQTRQIAINAEAKQNVRIITKDERKKFIDFLKNKPKGPVRLGFRYADVSPKLEAYEGQIASLLDEAHYTHTTECFRTFLPQVPPDCSICLFIKNYNSRPPYADALVVAFTNVADTVYGTIMPGPNGDLDLKTNDVMIFLLNYR